MKIKLIVYQLEDYINDYNVISDYMKRRSEYIKIMERVWVIKTNKSSASIRTDLSVLIKSPAKILVVDITETVWSTYGVSVQSSVAKRSYLISALVSVIVLHNIKNRKNA